jgi:hypothetical protein
VNIPSLSLAWTNTYTISSVSSIVICGRQICVPSLLQREFYRTFSTRMCFKSYAVLQLHFNIYYYFSSVVQSSMWQALWACHQRNKILQTFRIKHYIVIWYFDMVAHKIWFVTITPHLRCIPHCNSLD